MEASNTRAVILTKGAVSRSLGKPIALYGAIGLILLAASIAWLRPLLFSNATPNFMHDWMWSPLQSQLADNLSNRLSIIEPSSLGGFNVDSMTYAPLEVCSVIVRLFGSVAALKVIVVLAIVTGGLGMAWLSSLIVPNRIVNAALALLYAFGPVTVNKLVSGQVNAWFAIALLPWAFGAAIGLRRNSSVRGAGLLTILLAFIASQPHVFILFAALLLGLALASGNKRAFTATVLAVVVAAVTQIFTAFELVAASHAGDTGQFLSRLPWQIQQSSTFFDALTLHGYFANYYTAMLGRYAGIAEYALLVVALCAFSGLVAVCGRARGVYLAVAAAVIIALVSSFQTGLQGAAWQAFNRAPWLSLFRELYNFQEILAVIYGVGLSYAARHAKLQYVAVAGAAFVAMLTLISPLSRVIVTPNLSKHLSAAQTISDLPGNAKVWPIPNGRFLFTNRTQSGGFDPFFGRLGTHDVVEDYFAAPAVAAAIARPVQSTLPLLRAMGIGYVWCRKDFKWRPPSPQPQTEVKSAACGALPGSAIVSSPTDVVTAVRAARSRRYVTQLQIVPPLWSAGLRSLRAGRDFVFATDAAPLGVAATTQGPPDDRRFTDPHAGPVLQSLGPADDANLAEIALPAAVVSGEALQRVDFSNSRRLVVTDGSFDRSIARAVARHVYALHCPSGDACRPKNATFLVYSAPLMGRFAMTKVVQPGNASVLIDRSAYLPSLVARVGSATLPHFRVNGFENGWLVPRGDEAKVIVENRLDAPLRASRALALLAWVIALFLLWEPRIAKTYR